MLSQDLQNLSPEERIRRLQKLEADKRKQLEQKRKELEALEKKAKEEEEEQQKAIREAEELIRESIEDLQEASEKAYEELERTRQETEEEVPSLEERVEEHATPVKEVSYGAILEELKPDAGFYDLTHYNVAHAVEHMVHKSFYEGISAQEHEHLKNLRNRLEGFQANEEYTKKDNSNYLETMQSHLHKIEENLHLRSAYQKRKDEQRRNEMMYQ